MKVEALKGYVEQTWGWVEEEQRDYHGNHFVPAETQIIQYRGIDVGSMSVAEEAGGLRLKEINLLSRFQRMGIGTSLIGDLIDLAGQSGRSLSLQVLKVNPAVNLYKRLGFCLAGETETHHLLRYDHPSVT